MNRIVFLCALSFSGVSALRLPNNQRPGPDAATDGGTHFITIKLKSDGPEFDKVTSIGSTASFDVWAFFTTTEARVGNGNIPKIIEMLKKQTHPPSHIIINCGSNETLSAVATTIKGTSNTVTQVDNQFLTDIGPGTKYPRGEVLNQIPKDAYIFIADDDNVLDQKVIEKLITDTETANQATTGGNVVYGAFVRDIGEVPPGHNTKCKGSKLQFPLIYAFAGVLLKKAQLEGLDDFYQSLLAKEPMCKYVDDVWVSGYLFRRGYDVKRITNRKTIHWPKDVDRKTDDKTALNTKHDRGCENKKCIEAILQMPK